MKRNKSSIKNFTRAKKFLIAFVSAFIAVAIGVTFALCFGLSAKPVTVNDVQSGEAGQSARTLTDNLSGDQTSFGTLLAGDVINFTYSGGVHSITLPKGTYTLEVWGAQGGGAYKDGTYSEGLGLGGYMKGTWTASATTTLYICIGGQGANGVKGKYGASSVSAGGYNGGGNSGQETNSDANDEGGGGGGATHIATTNRGVLSNYASYTSEVLIVAGGGGGTAYNRSSGYSHGGGLVATAGYSGGGAGSTTAGTYGSAGSGGSGSTAGSFGQGGVGGNGSVGGGGGGGGWRGGGGGGSGMGGGGSGYFASSLSSTSESNGTQSGNGKARITVGTVNLAPRAKNSTTQTISTGLTLGVSGSKAVSASDFAEDSDSGSPIAKTSLAFTNGTASNLDTFTTTANSGLFLDSACTVSASTYMDWTWNSTAQFTITLFKMYPRNGTYSSANGTLNLYARVRDTFVSDSTNAVKQRGWAVIAFRLSVNKPTGAAITTATDKGSYIVGNSNTTTAPAMTTTSVATTSSIYNPNGTGRYTAICKTPLAVNQAFTLKAADLLTGTFSNTTYSTTYLAAVMSLTNTTNCISTNTARTYKVNDLDASTNKVTAYTTGKAAITNAFTQITITCVNPNAAYHVLPVTLYVTEKTSAYGSSYPYCVPDVTAVSMEIVFRLDNSRPYLKSTAVYDLGVGASANLSLDTYIQDANASTITTSTHKITEVIVPQQEFVQLNRYGVTVSTNAGNYNVGTVQTTSITTGRTATSTNFNTAIAYNATAGGSDTSNTAFMKYSYTGITLTVTGLRASFSQYLSTRTNALGHFYLLLHIQDLRETGDTGIWAPIAFRVGYSTSYSPVATITAPNSGISTTNYTGQTNSSVMPTASGSVGKNFYFAPMAVNYGTSQVIGKYKTEDASGNNTGALTSTSLQPLAIDGDNFAATSGLASWNGSKLNEFLQISSASTPTTIVQSMSSVGFGSDSTSAWNNYIKVSYLDVYVDSAYLASATYSGGRVIAGSGTAADNGFKYAGLGSAVTVEGKSYYVIKGLKITLRSATMNRYFAASVTVGDVTGKTVSVNIAVRVNNTAPTAVQGRTDVQNPVAVATYKDAKDANAYSAYAYDPNNSNVSARVTVPTVTYRIPLYGNVIVTPYDFVSDYNINMAFGSTTDFSSRGGFTLNGLSGNYSSGLLDFSTGNSVKGLFDKSKYASTTYISALSTYLNAVTNTKASVSKVGTAYSSSATFSAANVYNDKLFFARSSGGTDAYSYNPVTTDFVVSQSNTMGFVSSSYGSKVKIGSSTYEVDFILLTGVTRTTQPAVIELTVRDRYGNSSDGVASFTVRIVVEVVNTAPNIKNENRYEELAVTPVTVSGKVYPDVFSFGSNGNDSLTGLMEDYDKDTPEFVTARGTIVANTKNLATLYPELTSFSEVGAQYLTDDGTAGGRLLTEYVTSALVTRYELTATAHSSTKMISSGVYIYFFASDGNGGISLGFVQIEVINTAPVLNTEDDGFDGADPLWAVESTSEADIARNRYIVGSKDAWYSIKQISGAIDSDIRLISTDADGLHSKTTLAPIGVQSAGQKHVNLVVPADKNTAITAAALEKAVPKLAVATSFAAGQDPDPIAVIVYTTVTSNGQTSVSAALPADKLQTEILFLYNNSWVTRDALITALTGKKIAEMSEYFDEKGRFISTDWAVHLQASVGFASNKRLSIKLSLRDEVMFGGDTAGEATAYAPLRSTGNKAAVVGAFTPAVHYFVSQTGIRTKDEYTLNYNDYYVVESNGKAYVSTYDGRTDSLYTADDNTSNITYNESDGTRVLAANGTVTLKTRAENAADETLAGTNSGIAYNASTINNIDGTYKYPSVIEIPASGEYVYIPMSYFGLLQDLVGVESSVSSETRGKVMYLDEYVGYDVGSAELVRSNIANFASAITLSDGSDSWTGSDLLNNNSSHPQPYLEITAFDDYSKNGTTSSSAKFESDLSKPYYNNRLAVPTTNSANELIGYERYAANRNSFVGNGEIMYLEEQAKYLQEHNFGLAIRKSDMRTGLRNLTLTIKLAKSSGSKNVVPENDDDEAQLKRTVTVNIHIENSKIDLAVDNGTDVKFDGKTYYMDITMATATSQSFALSRLDGTGNVETISNDYKDVTKIAYTDDDYNNATYRDKAYFLADSFIALKRWSLGEAAYNRVMTLNSDGDALLYTTMGVEGTAGRAQSSLYNYFGIQDASDIADVDVTKYQPNGGIYGSNSNGNVNGYDGYSSYFSASLSESGRVLNIMSSHQTFINEIALERYLGEEPMTQTNVAALYEARGLVAEYADETVNPAKPTRVYYPFKTLIYDSCGVGFSDASYVSIELRIEITNATPSLKKVGDEVTDVSGNVTGREYRFNLAVGNSITINLYDLIADADMFVEGTKGYYTLATKTQFKDDAAGVDLETGDYLASPYMYDEYLLGKKTLHDTAYPNADGTYYRDGGGLSIMDDDTKDVAMWMETKGVTAASTDVEPRTNNLSFTVYRRSTAEIASDGARNVTVNEYRFTLKFYDSYGEQTQYFTFIINITNSAPVITAETRSFTMRSGDDLTVLTTYYDNFIGNGNGNNNNGSNAYRNSATRTYYDARKALSGYGETFGDGENNATTGDKSFWLFSDITSNYKNDIIYNTTVGEIAERKNVHLGYLGLANDDTPWRMRITDIDYDGNSGLTVETNFSLKTEGTSSSEASFMAIDIRARGTCVNEPVTITLSDGENGNVTCVLYFTVVSTPPEALDYNNLADKKLIDEAGLEPEKADNGEYKSGVYRLFTVPTGEAKVEVENFEGEVKTARSSYTIAMKNVAKDPDGDDETSGMTLYGDGFFTVNDDTALVRGSDGAYHADYFTIRVAEGNKSFTITATGYNPNSENGYEKLTFLVADDYGKGGFENAIQITIYIYTMYSDMTNPAVAAMGISSTAYNSYMGGSNSVYVKPYDEYCSSAVLNPSKYAFVSLKGNVGTDGNITSPIVDPDTADAGERAYTARLYAFIDGDASKNNFAPLSAATLKSMFKTDSAKKTFMLDKSKSGTGYSEYMIGGVSYNGTALRVDSSAALRLSYVRQFVDFEFAENGSALVLMPNAATLNNNIILYVEAEKYIDEGRGYKRTDAVLTAGELFKLVVNDSAPNAVTDVEISEFAGYNQAASGSAYEGDSEETRENIISFKIFDSASSLASLFSDSDKGDFVTVKSISDKDYEEKILKKALKENPNLDWAASQGKPRAFDIEIDDATNTLSIKINRRIDEYKNGKYSESVSFPIEIEGVDLGGKTATSTILLTIRNSNVTVSTESYSKYDSETGIGYTLSRSLGNSSRVSYNIDARVKYSHALEINIFDFISDSDYSADADIDSFRFAQYVEVYPYEYITDKTQTVYWYETNSSGGINTNKFKELAMVEPLGDDQWHMNGLKITALDTSRTLTGKTYIRILDRSAEVVGDAGVFITLNITVMNDAPYVISGMEATSIIMLGSDKATPNGMLFNIADFVDDINDSDVVGDSKSANSETYLRIFSQQALAIGGIYSRKYTDTVGASEETTGSSLFTVTVPRVLPEDLLNDYLDRNSLDASFKDTSNEYNQWFVITPIEGYYGSSAVEITVADGDLFTHVDTLTTTFRINVSVVYDPDEMSSVLNPIEIACSKTRTLNIDALMPELENKLVSEAGVVTSASGNTFSQAEYYILTYVDLQNNADSIYGTFEHVGTSGEWVLTAGKQVTFDPVRVNVRYALISDPSKVYSKYFWLTVVANAAPTCKFDEITFTRYNRTGDTLRDLSDSNSVSLEAWQLFRDEDDPEGSSLRYISAKSSVPSIVSVSLSDDKRYLMLKFAARGEADITVEVTDETGTPIPLTFTVRNDDLPEGSLWLRISGSFEANTAIWVIIICVVAVLLIVLMIVLAVLRKRKRDREELEALLVSEMEIEDTMLKLAGAPSPTDYQSFGYLQSGAPIDQNGGMMLGEGLGEADSAQVPNLIQSVPDDGGEIPPTDGTM